MMPDERDSVVERLIEGLGPPQPPPDLRSSVLTAARAQITGKSVNDFWSKIWNNRGVRLAWVASVVLLLAGHVFLVPGNGAVPSRVDPKLAAEISVDEQFVDLLRPIEISVNVQPIIGIFASAGDPTDLDMKGNPS